jgi:hypothetical protein
MVPAKSTGLTTIAQVYLTYIKLSVDILLVAPLEDNSGWQDRSHVASLIVGDKPWRIFSGLPGLVSVYKGK